MRLRRHNIIEVRAGLALETARSILALFVAWFNLAAQMGNTFGQLFRVTTFGESHGGGIGVVIDGCPPKIDISQSDIQRELDRRRPGQSKITSQRGAEDRCEILSAIFQRTTLGN